MIGWLVSLLGLHISCNIGALHKCIRRTYSLHPSWIWGSRFLRNVR